MPPSAATPADQGLVVARRCRSGRDLQGAAFLFFAFAGYARIATLGEEVRDPARTIPRAIPVALGIALAVYAAVALALLAVLGPTGIAETSAPLAAAARASGWAWVEPLVRVGPWSLPSGRCSRCCSASHAPRSRWPATGTCRARLAAVHPRYQVPHHAELAVGAVVVVVVLLADVRSAIGFSSFAVLAYYAIANASALTVRPTARSVLVPADRLGAGAWPSPPACPWRPPSPGSACCARRRDLGARHAPTTR